MSDGQNKCETAMRRRKVLYVHPQIIAEVLCNWRQHDSVALPVLAPLPEDAIVVYAFAAPERYASPIGLVVQSETFDPVDPGTELPELAPSIHDYRQIIPVAHPFHPGDLEQPGRHN